MTSIQLELPFPPEEEWRDVPGYEDYYRVSDSGRIKITRSRKRFKAGTILSAKRCGKDYRSISLCVDGHQKRYYIHRLVLLAFEGECPPGHEVNHKNGDKSDNRVSNLEYVTHQVNVAHAKHVLFRMGGAKGTEHKGAKLTPDKVREIRKALATGDSLSSVGRLFGVSAGAIWAINRGSTWKHVK